MVNAVTKRGYVMVPEQLEKEVMQRIKKVLADEGFIFGKNSNNLEYARCYHKPKGFIIYIWLSIQDKGLNQKAMQFMLIHKVMRPHNWKTKTVKRFNNNGNPGNLEERIRFRIRNLRTIITESPSCPKCGNYMLPRHPKNNPDDAYWRCIASGCTGSQSMHNGLKTMVLRIVPDRIRSKKAHA